MHFGTMTAIPVMDGKGIVTFPSFHTACGLMAAVLAWANRWLRWPFLIWSALLIAGTPIDGGHYLADILAGGLITAAVLIAAHVYTGRTAPRAPGHSPVRSGGVPPAGLPPLAHPLELVLEKLSRMFRSGHAPSP